MIVIASGKDGPVCATYNQERAVQAVHVLRGLYPGVRFWYYPEDEDRIEALNLEVLCSSEDCQLVDEVSVTLQTINGILCPDYKLVRRSLRGLVRNHAIGDSQMVRGTASSYDLAEQHARWYLGVQKQQQ